MSDTPPSPPPSFNDVRDDYDEQFGASLTPRGIALRKVRLPAFAFMATGVIGVLGSLVGATAFVMEQARYGLRDEFMWVGTFIGVWALLMLACFFVTFIVAGRRFLQLRSYPFVLRTAYFVTGLSIAGPYAILFYPFGIWALVLLSRDDMKKEFDGAVTPTVGAS